LLISMTILLNPVARGGQAAHVPELCGVRFTATRKLGYNGINELLRVFKVGRQ